MKKRIALLFTLFLILCSATLALAISSPVVSANIAAAAANVAVTAGVSSGAAPFGFSAGIAWVTANWLGIVAAMTSVVTAASVIARLTPTPRDDEFVAKLVRVIDFLAINTPRTR